MRIQQKDVLGLYRAVLRCHAQRLPPPMRSMGDSYARDEFRRHRDAKPPTTEAQWSEFVLEWTRYVRMLEGQADSPGFSGSMDDSVLKRMSPEQQLRLNLLKEEAEKLGGNTGSTTDQ